jgi:hypothetical protein
MARLCAVFCVVAFSLPAWAAGAQRPYLDSPFRQVRATSFKNEVDLKGYELRTVRVDRDGKVLINTNKGLLKAFDGRLVQWRELAALEKLDHRDLELLKGKFVFLTNKMFLPLHGAGADYLDNSRSRFTRVATAGAGHYLLMSAERIVEVRGGKTTEQPNPGYSEVIRNPYDNSFVLYAGDKLARYRDGVLSALPMPPAHITGVLAVAKDDQRLATDKGLFAVTAQGATVVPRPLPTNDLTCIAADSSGRLWIGSNRGAFSLDKAGRLDYYAGKRWIPSDRVIDLFVDAHDDVYVLTTGGVARLAFEPMTLAEKADACLKNLRLHHIRFGLVSDTNLIDGDYAYTRNNDSDNDGLWSGIYLSAEAFRYAVTKDRSAFENVTDGLDALERLVSITGIPGFQARSFELEGFKVSDPQCWRTRPQHDFEWKGTTSSDEIVGTLFFYSVFDETVARDDPALHKRVALVVSAIVDHIIDHRLYLVDIDGKPTQWGRWNPEYVNTRRIGGDRRLNSVEILSFLQLAYALNPSLRYKDTFYDLVRNHGYADNTVQYLPDPMGEWNHSDDELYWLSYYNLIRHCFDAELKKTFLQSARAHYEATKRKANPLWNFTYGSITGDPIDLDGSIRVLREFPLDRRDWRMENSHRKDVRLSRRPGAELETTAPLSPAERSVHKWNHNELEPDGGGNGNSAESGAEYLLPYWMGRYDGYISPPQPSPR